MRPASTGDLQTLLDLMADFYAEAGCSLDRPHAAEAFAALLADPPLARIWLIKHGAAVGGHVV